MDRPGSTPAGYTPDHLRSVRLRTVAASDAGCGDADVCPDSARPGADSEPTARPSSKALSKSEVSVCAFKARETPQASKRLPR